MPAPTFTIQYKPDDFFYNTVDTVENAELLSSFPFTQEKVIEWANKVAHPEPLISSVSDIFDPKLSAIILNPEYDFKNTFLPGHMSFNDNFKKIALNLSTSGSEITNNMTSESASISGQIILKPTSPDKQPTTLEINTGKDSTIEWTKDESNNWQPSFDINAALSEEIPFTDVDGGQSTIIKTSDNPRCKYRKTCTMNHWHYSGPCKTQIVKSANGSTTCKCVCSGVPVFSNTAHSHCDSYTINANGTADTPVGQQAPPPGLGLVSAIQGMKLKLNAQFPQSDFLSDGSGENDGTGLSDGTGTASTTSGASQNASMPYKNSNTLIQNDKTIRQLIADYYFQVSENIRLQKTIKSRGIKDVTSQQALMDATVQYKTEYLKVFNIIAGIVGAGGYIYLMNQS